MAGSHRPERTITMDAQHHHHDDIHYAVSSAAFTLSDTRCAHGDPAVDSDLTGTPCQPGALPDHINVLIPRCGFADIVGGIIAQIRHHEGTAAADRFIGTVYLAQTNTRHQITRNAR
ncbi:hypothetical protein ACFXAZ_38450 [Streptomyces sp. NPDC059477]|uniref:hypothetical protein n=1 Tax=Streptomyces sp. NPDC059477 TaxID=3346847 RepID=UPI00368CD4C3